MLLIAALLAADMLGSLLLRTVDSPLSKTIGFVVIYGSWVLTFVACAWRVSTKRSLLAVWVPLIALGMFVAMMVAVALAERIDDYKPPTLISFAHALTCVAYIGTVIAAAAAAASRGKSPQG
jgi:hypothetical protein